MDLVLYRQRCGQCHGLHHPGSLTPKMWEATMVRMEVHIARSGRAALSAAERARILAYLQRNAGGR